MSAKIPDSPPWKFNKPRVILDLTNNIKSVTDPLILRSNFNELKEKYTDHFQIYTDGSKADNYVGCASISDIHRFRERLPCESSIFTAESQALKQSLRFIGGHCGQKYIIFTDSLSVLVNKQYESHKPTNL